MIQGRFCIGVIYMNIPKDIPLATWIRQLIADNRLIVFYKSKEWIELRDEVMHDNHYECQECLKRGRYTRADCVHHVNEVRHRPDLALNKYYTDKEGNKQKNLLPLCNRCHNQIHDKLGYWQRKDKFTNEEKW
jgi:5-methylcytosine-specific restriction endonuclease McrA